MLEGGLQKRVRRALAAAGVAAVLSGCATTNPALDTPVINHELAARGAPPLAWDKNRAGQDETMVHTLLAEPMTADRAVRVAMLRSPRLQSEFARLGLARADILEAVQVANPHFTVSRLGLQSGDGSQLVLGLSAPLVDLLVLPSRVRLARSDYERARLEIAAAVLAVSLDVEEAWYDYVGARQVAEMRQAVAVAQATSAELARRYYEAGNITQLQLARETAAESQARINAAHAKVAAKLARLKLDTSLGLSGADAEWATTDRLALPVPTEDDPATLERLAHDGNLSLLAARREVAILADAAGVTRRFRLLGGTQIGYEREREVDGSVIHGPTLDVELPIFNQGGAKVARADARLLAARASLARIELATDNAVRLGAERVRVSSNVVAMHRDGLVPARETIVERSQQEQNFMLIGVFDLIQAKTQEYDAYQSYLESIRDYWLARLDLMRVVGAHLPSEAMISAAAPSAEEILAPKGGGMNHAGHHPAPEAGAPMDPGMSAPGMSMPAPGGAKP